MTDYTERTRTFEAKDDLGRSYLICEFTDFCDTTTMNEGPSYIPGLRRLQASDGQPINYISKGHYQLVGVPNIDLTSNDPNAPYKKYC